jgi:hypothetical protein
MEYYFLLGDQLLAWKFAAFPERSVSEAPYFLALKDIPGGF